MQLLLNILPRQFRSGYVARTQFYLYPFYQLWFYLSFFAENNVFPFFPPFLLEQNVKQRSTVNSVFKHIHFESKFPYFKMETKIQTGEIETGVQIHCTSTVVNSLPHPNPWLL